MFWKPAAASCLIVPGKSLAMPSLTGQVWQPIGRPRGLARSSKAADNKLTAATLDAAFCRNALLDRSDMDGSLFFHFVIDAVAQAGEARPAPTVPSGTGQVHPQGSGYFSSPKSLMSSGPSWSGLVLRPCTSSRIWATISGLESVVMSLVSM